MHDFRGRFEAEFGLGLKALLLLIEGDLNTSLQLIPCTGTGHEQAVFRAQTVTAEGRLLRNRCMHYEITDPKIRPDLSLPMFGLVEAVAPGTTWHDHGAGVLTAMSRLADCLGAWHPG